jgi:type VI secretion system protein ImpC
MDMADQMLQPIASAEASEVTFADDFAMLLHKEFKPANEARQQRIERAVKTLAQQALEDAAVVGDDVYMTVDGLKAAIDRKLSEQVNAIIHHAEFQALESAWRGLWYLVGNTSTGKDLKIRVLNISKEETRRQFRQYRDAAWDQSPLFKKVYEAEFGQLGGQPYGAMICDFTFDHSGPDLEVMKGLSKIGAAAHAPFIAAAGPGLIGMDSWRELANPRDLAKQFEATDYLAWRSFRASNDSRYMALTLPRFWAARFMGRRPIRSRISPSRKRSRGSTTNICGSTPPMRWACGSPRRSRPMAGARAFAALNRAARWRICRSHSSRPTRVASTPNAPPKSRFPTGARPNCRARA